MPINPKHRWQTDTFGIFICNYIFTVSFIRLILQFHHNNCALSAGREGNDGNKLDTFKL